VETAVYGIACLLAASLCSGCALVGAGRASLGVTATTEGAVGLAVSGEFAGGVMILPDESPSGAVSGVAVTEGLYLGGGATSDGWELETGGHWELGQLDSDRERRVGLRFGILARELRAPAFTGELALALADAGWWALSRPRIGLELRAGPLIAARDGAPAFEGLRGFVGITYQATATTRRYNPFAHMLDDVGKH
jgi:hypothetical protein